MKLSVLLNPQALMSTYIYETTVHVEVLTALYPCCLFSFVYCVCDNFRLCMSFIHVALSCEFFCLCNISLYAVVAQLLSTLLCTMCCRFVNSNMPYWLSFYICLNIITSLHVYLYSETDLTGKNLPKINGEVKKRRFMEYSWQYLSMNQLRSIHI